MRNSAVKRIIAVLLCLVVFAGSELTGLTNIVGDLFASEMEVADEEGNEPDSQVDEIEIEAPAEESEAEPQPEMSGEPAAPETPAESAVPEAPAVVEETPEETADPAVEEPDTGNAENENGENVTDPEKKEDENAADPEEKDDLKAPEQQEEEETAKDPENGDDLAAVDDTEPTETETESGVDGLPAEEDTEDPEKEADGMIEGEPTGEETEETAMPVFEDDQRIGDVVIYAKADEGVFPEGTKLMVTPIVKQDVEELEAQAEITPEEIEEIREINEKYDATAEKLEETVAEDDSKNIAGFLAYDIFFLVPGEDGGMEEKEPDGNVTITMEFDREFLPEELVDNEYVSVDSVDIVHMKETDGELQPEVLADAAIDITENVEVKTAEFTVDSFSIFTISWTGSGLPMVTIEFTDESGGSLNNVEPVALTISEEFTFDTKEISPTGQWSQYYQIRESMSDGTGGLKDVDYVFSKAIYLPDNGYGTETGEKIPISKIHITDQQVVEWYDADNALLGRQKWGIEDGHPSPFKIRCMYSSSSKEELKILSREKLLDSTSKGVRMYMKDYSFNYKGLNETLGGIVDGNQNAKQGLVKKRLVDGYPVAADGTSLKPWFEDGVQVNRLFLKEKYDTDGTFYYSSFENYAYLGRNTEFTVYDEIGTPETYVGDDCIYANRGNFFPYNDINTGNGYGELSKCRQLYDEYGNRINGNKKLYKTDGTTNFHFSMKLETDFIQAKGGMYNGRPMVYEFNGDDDLWVFIDDILVLDIGGNHEARSGSINFATGEVTVNQPNNSTIKTNIRACFSNAEAEGECEWRGNTFEDYSAHTLKMFYMERNDKEGTGVGGSNLKMSFHLPTIEKGQIRVMKQLSGTDQVEYANVPFDFRVMVQEIDTVHSTEDHVVYLDSYVPLKVNGRDFEDGSEITVDQETGIFQLKPGQSALFSDLNADRNYYVEEIGYHTSGSGDYTVDETSYMEIDENDHPGETVTGVKTEAKEVGSRKSVVFTNRCSSMVRNDLQITKVMKGNTEGSGPFNIRLWLENRNGVLVPYEGAYLAGGQSHTTNDGKIRLSAGETATIQGLIAGTQFYVEETDLDLKTYQEPVITLTEGTFDPLTSEDTCTDSASERTAQGAVKRGSGNTARVTVENALLGDTSSGLKITKRMEGDAAGITEPFVFEILLKNPDGTSAAYKGNYSVTSASGTVREETSDGRIQIPVDATATIDLEAGTEFQVKEILGEGYNAPKITVASDTVSNWKMDENAVTGAVADSQYADITVTNVPRASYAYGWRIVKKGTEAGTPNLEGAEFTLTLSGKQGAESKVYYGRSQSGSGVIAWFETEGEADNGEKPVDIKTMVPGEYELKETKAPAGYVLSSNSWKLTLDYQTIKVVDTSTGETVAAVPADDGKMYEYTFNNDVVYELPSTGGTGIFGYMISGTLLMMAGILILYKRKFAGRC